MTADELRAIRTRNDNWCDYGGDAPMAPMDRAKLLTEVDRLTAELSDARLAVNMLADEVDRLVAELVAGGAA